MSRFFIVLAAFAFAAQSIPSIAAPLPATGKWVMDYAATACEAKRQFGDVALAISPGPLGQSWRLLIELPGKALRARQHPARIDPVDGQGPNKISVLMYPSKKNGMRRIFAVVPNALVDRALDSRAIDVRIGNVPNTGRLAISAAHVELDLGPTKGLRTAIDTCMTDLRKTWGMIDGKLPVPAKASQAQGDVRGIFTSNDYPEDAMAANQSGTAQFLLMIGRDGSVMDCVVMQSSGVASLDVMGCQVIRERAKFQPATDGQGKPTLDTMVTPPIRWAISG